MAISQDVKALEAAVKRGFLPASVLQTTLSPYRVLQVLHSYEHCARSSAPITTRGWRTTRPETRPQVSLTVEEVAQYELCYCFSLGNTPALREAILLCNADNVARLAERVKPGKLAPGSVQKKLRDISRSIQAVEFLNRKHNGAGASPQVFPELSHQVTKRLLAAQESLQALLVAPVTRARLLSAAVKSLYNNHPAHLDETPVLVGLLGSYFPKTIEEFKTTFALRQENNLAVLLMPRYAYDYLQRECYRTNSSPVLLVAYAASDDDEVNSTAAALWSPADVSSPSADLYSALRTAQALESEND